MDDAGVGDVTIWHHGLIARWWANFNTGGPEIEFFGRFVAGGQPALDLGCGSGRLLVPWVKEGLDVDGVDASADMIDACRRAALAAGCEPALHVQAVHGLELDRRYGTIVMCGSFGLGATRAQDLEASGGCDATSGRGGLLALDSQVGEADDRRWASWRPRPADPLSTPEQERRLGADDYHYALRHRVTDLDAATRRMTRELQAWQWSGREVVAHETHEITINVYTSEEIVALLAEAGFGPVRVVGGYHGEEPTEADEFHVFLATAAGDG